MSLRISPPGKDGRPRRGPGGEQLDEDFYMSRLVKLVPGEAIAVYPLVHGRADDVVDSIRMEMESDALRRSVETVQSSVGAAGETITSSPEATSAAIQKAADIANAHGAYWLPIAVTWGVLLMVIALRWQATRGPNGDAQWGAVAIAAISFFLLVPTMGGTFGILEFANDLKLIDWPEAIRNFVPEILLTFWTLLIPAFYKPQS